MTRHTPGPWRVGETYRADRHGMPVEVTPIYGEGISVAQCDASFQEERPMVAANAALIAAAPDLLAALRDLTAVIRDIRDGKRDGAIFGNLSIADDNARSAIARAEGR
jgi:hypothetical protein